MRPALLLWLITLFCGFGALSLESDGPGLAANPAVRWPARSEVPSPRARPLLIMLLQAGCPCSRASVHELSQFLLERKRDIDVYVVFVGGLRDEPLEQQLAELPGVHVIHDPAGVEARRFHSATSGQVMLYDSHGRLRFCGGITAARGHEGDNEGIDGLRALAAGNHPEWSITPVFGCPLR